jgi:hypothetical protein
MKRTPCMLVLLMISVWVPTAAAADLHAVIDYRWTYMDSERVYQVDYWFGVDREYVKRRETITLVRRDLDLVWRIDGRDGSYTEEKLTKKNKRQRQEPNDIHTRGFDYIPRFDWIVEETGQEKMIGKFMCRGFVIDGDADFSEVTVELWVAMEAEVPQLERLNETMLGFLKDSGEQEEVTAILLRWESSLLIGFTEVWKPPIAPTSRRDVTLVTVETKTAPAGLYDLPEGLCKAGGTGGGR